MDEPIEVPFRVWARVGPTNHVSDGGGGFPSSQNKGQFWGIFQPIVKYMKYPTCAAKFSTLFGRWHQRCVVSLPLVQQFVKLRCCAQSVRRTASRVRTTSTASTCVSAVNSASLSVQTRSPATVRCLRSLILHAADAHLTTAIRYDTRCYFNVPQKPMWVSLIHRTEPATKKCQTEY